MTARQLYRSAPFLLVLSGTTLSADAFVPSIRHHSSISTSISTSTSFHLRPNTKEIRTIPVFSSSSSSLKSSASPPQKDKSVIPDIPYITKTVPSDRSKDTLLGEDAGVFDVKNEKWGAFGETGWLTFSAAVGTILTAVIVLWVYHPTGYSDDFTAALEQIAGGNPHIVTLLYGIIFPVVHSGLAALRPLGEKLVGARTWRVIFAFPSLCLSYSWIAYFISHAHSGMQFYDLSQLGWAHGVAWTVNFSSFLFLYPSVFNLKEVAAVETPKIHLWETGMIRITRHPQFVGQVMWSAGHLAMVGTSFTALTMALLVGHHYFSCWHGDRRLYDEHGDDFLKIKERTSVFPFLAIVEGRQVLPTDYYKEMLRAPYALIAGGTIAAYYAHPYMQAGAAIVTNTGLVEGGILNSIF